MMVVLQFQKDGVNMAFSWCQNETVESFIAMFASSKRQLGRRIIRSIHEKEWRKWDKQNQVRWLWMVGRGKREFSDRRMNDKGAAFIQCLDTKDRSVPSNTTRNQRPNERSLDGSNVHARFSHSCNATGMSKFTTQRLNACPRGAE